MSYGVGGRDRNLVLAVERHRVHKVDRIATCTPPSQAFLSGEGGWGEEKEENEAPKKRWDVKERLTRDADRGDCCVEEVIADERVPGHDGRGSMPGQKKTEEI